MKILNKLIVLYLCCCITAKSIVPKNKAQTHKKYLKRQRKAESNGAVSCYENCRNQQSQALDHSSPNRIHTGQKEVYHNTMNHPENHDENWQPQSFLLKPIYNITKDSLKTGTMITSDVLGARMQMENDLHQAQARVEYNQQMQEHQLESQKLKNDTELQEERIHQNDKIYKEEQLSPYYQEQMASMNNQSGYRLV